MKTERELFEAWAYSKKWNIFRVRDMGIDRYVDDFVDGAWSGWQASANREGYKLVPVEINDEIEAAMFSSVTRCADVAELTVKPELIALVVLIIYAGVVMNGF